MAASASEAPVMQQMNWGEALLHGGPIEILVFVVLIVFSVVVLAVIFERWREQGALARRSAEFLKLFWDSASMSDLHVRSKDLPYSPAREVFRSGYNEMIRVVQAAGTTQGALPFDTVRRALARAQGQEEVVLARNLPFLAIAASACPFIGLFGTVVGIIRAFHDIGASGSASLASVAPGISAALVATALGLVSAIPASIFFNVFQNSARKHLAMLEAFAADYLNILERHFVVGSSSAAPGHGMREPT
jgi:biopolymer transport protein TolQ